MMPADTDVRTGRRPATENQRGAGGFALARLLLRSLELLPNLDQKLVLLLVASLTSACIIPVGPQWQDPAGAPNAGPEILDQFPVPGDEATGDRSYSFSITARDDNGDKLHLRWLVGSPILGTRPIEVDNPEIGASGNGAPSQGKVEESIGCTDLGFTTETRFTVTAAVADRKFDENDLLVVPEPGKLRKVVWILNLTCGP